MVIATQQIGKVIAGARADSFVESYQMVAKQVQTYIISDQTDDIACTTNCQTKYGLSNDYTLTVVKNSDTFTITLAAADDGKFANIDLTKYGKTKCTTEIEKVRNATTTKDASGNTVKEKIMDIGTFKNNVCTSNSIEGSVTEK